MQYIKIKSLPQRAVSEPCTRGLSAGSNPSAQEWHPWAMAGSGCSSAQGSPVCYEYRGTVCYEFLAQNYSLLVWGLLFARTGGFISRYLLHPSRALKLPTQLVQHTTPQALTDPEPQWRHNKLKKIRLFLSTRSCNF